MGEDEAGNQCPMSSNPTGIRLRKDVPMRGAPRKTRAEKTKQGNDQQD